MGGADSESRKVLAQCWYRGITPRVLDACEWLEVRQDERQGRGTWCQYLRHGRRSRAPWRDEGLVRAPDDQVIAEGCRVDGVAVDAGGVRADRQHRYRLRLDVASGEPRCLGERPEVGHGPLENSQGFAIPWLMLSW